MVLQSFRGEDLDGVAKMEYAGLFSFFGELKDLGRLSFVT